MRVPDAIGAGFRGDFRDVLRDASGRVVWERDWQHNVIVADARRLLAGFLKDSQNAFGIRGLEVGSGNAAWDATAPPTPQPSQSALVAPLHTLPVGQDLTIEYLEPNSENTTTTPTNRLQIFARFGPGVPSNDHTTLREFGLVGQLAGGEVLINYRTHQAIAKDPTSSLERTIWLVL